MKEITHEYIKGNSFKLLPEMEDQSVDMILTDPPYDMPRNKIWTIHSEFIRICRGTTIVFMPPENQWLHPADSYLFWIKPISTKNTSRRYSRFVEMIFVYNITTWNSNRHWSQYTNVFTDLVDDTSLHPYRKPPSLIERLLLNHTNTGDLVLDPFAGSGVVGEVCEALNRSSICIDIAGISG
jgi:DNA modification methylase